MGVASENDVGSDEKAVEHKDQSQYGALKVTCEISLRERNVKDQD